MKYYIKVREDNTGVGENWKGWYFRSSTYPAFVKDREGAMSYGTKEKATETIRDQRSRWMLDLVLVRVNEKPKDKQSQDYVKAFDALEVAIRDGYREATHNVGREAEKKIYFSLLTLIDAIRERR